MRIHLIAIGGAAMHNIALALQQNGHVVSGSDDEIYDPARTRLARAGLLPSQMGWFPENLDAQLDLVILGMHARKDNPELLRAQALGLPIYSYPAFIQQQATLKTRVVVAGSHGKTTTTAMILHVLKKAGMAFDYLVGAQLEGFDTMVQLSDAPIMVVEGDEYYASALEPVSKMVQYKPHIAVITGIAWDHINVFPTFEIYLDQFRMFLDQMEAGGRVVWYAKDQHLQKLMEKTRNNLISMPYEQFEWSVKQGISYLEHPITGPLRLSFFGAHNLQNARAACLVCSALGVSEPDFVRYIADFKGASKRLQNLRTLNNHIAWIDFAHAPSKVRATVSASKVSYPERGLTAVLELHTYSSLNQDFLPEYANSLQLADEAVVYYSLHTLEMKGLPTFTPEQVSLAFKHPNLQVFTQKQDLMQFIQARNWAGRNLLLMSSGTFDGIDLNQILPNEPDETPFGV